MAALVIEIGSIPYGDPMAGTPLAFAAEAAGQFVRPAGGPAPALAALSFRLAGWA
jgi:hypothetical protein